MPMLICVPWSEWQASTASLRVFQKALTETCWKQKDRYKYNLRFDWKKGCCSSYHMHMILQTFVLDVVVLCPLYVSFYMLTLQEFSTHPNV